MENAALFALALFHEINVSLNILNPRLNCMAYLEHSTCSVYIWLVFMA